MRHNAGHPERSEPQSGERSRRTSLGAGRESPGCCSRTLQGAQAQAKSHGHGGWMQICESNSSVWPQAKALKEALACSYVGRPQ
jgi:hypothetical protein